MNGVNQLAGRGHQLAPEVLMMAADHRVHIVFLIASTSTAKVAAAAQGLGDGIACVGRELGQRVMGLFGDAFCMSPRLTSISPV